MNRKVWNTKCTCCTQDRDSVGVEEDVHEKNAVFEKDRCRAVNFSLSAEVWNELEGTTSLEDDILQNMMVQLGSASLQESSVGKHRAAIRLLI